MRPQKHTILTRAGQLVQQHNFFPSALLVELADGSHYWRPDEEGEAWHQFDPDYKEDPTWTYPEWNFDGLPEQFEGVSASGKPMVLSAVQKVSSELPITFELFVEGVKQPECFGFSNAGFWHSTFSVEPTEKGIHLTEWAQKHIQRGTFRLIEQILAGETGTEFLFETYAKFWLMKCAELGTNIDDWSLPELAVVAHNKINPQHPLNLPENLPLTEVQRAHFECRQALLQVPEGSPKEEHRPFVEAALRYWTLKNLEAIELDDTAASVAASEQILKFQDDLARLAKLPA